MNALHSINIFIFRKFVFLTGKFGIYFYQHLTKAKIAFPGCSFTLSFAYFL